MGMISDYRWIRSRVTRLTNEIEELQSAGKFAEADVLIEELQIAEVEESRLQAALLNGGVSI